MSVTVRRARFEDAKRVGKLALKLVVQHQNYDEHRFSRLYDEEQAEWFYGKQTKSETAAVLVAEIENEIIGFAYVEYETVNYAEMLENAAWLHDIYVDETARGSGAGKLLIEASIKTAKKFGAEKLMLTVAARNEDAQKFFENQGFQPTMIEMMLDLTEK